MSLESWYDNEVQFARVMSAVLEMDLTSDQWRDLANRLDMKVGEVLSVFETAASTFNRVDGTF